MPTDRLTLRDGLHAHLLATLPLPAMECLPVAAVAGRGGAEQWCLGPTPRCVVVAGQWEERTCAHVSDGHFHLHLALLFLWRWGRGRGRPAPPGALWIYPGDHVCLHLKELYVG